MEAPLGNRAVAGDAAPVGPARDRSPRTFDLLDAFPQPPLQAQVVFAHLRIARGLGGVMMAIRALVAVSGKVMLGGSVEQLLLELRKTLLSVTESGARCHPSRSVTAVRTRRKGRSANGCANLVIADDMEGAGVSYAIEATGLERAFKGGIRAVAGVDLHVAKGEIFGFLGPNGAGKSTTVRILTTLLRPTGGTATVAGHDVVREASAVRRRIGVALQDAAIDPFMTGRELLHLQAVLHGISRHDGRSRAQALLEQLELTGAAERRVGTYSGGMRRRLDLALSLVHEPVVLFLDEPTTGLDPHSRLTVWNEVRRLNRELGTTVFLTTQYLEEADQLAGRIAIIDLGRIVAQGTPAELKASVGEPALSVTLADPGQRASAEGVLARLGVALPGSSRTVAIRMPDGAAGLAPVVRALDEAGIAVAKLDLSEPSLDDVFLAKTGRSLHAEDEDDAAA